MVAGSFSLRARTFILLSFLASLLLVTPATAYARDAVWAWAGNFDGQLGDNSIYNSNLPVQVEDPTGTSTLTGVIAVAAGSEHSLALKSDGTVLAWGDNANGQLGNNSTTESNVPVQVKDPTGTSNLTGVIAVAAGAFHSLAVENDGSVWAWGSNEWGQLGNNSTTDSDVPVQVKDPTGTSALTGVIAVAGGWEHSLALKSDGTVWAWGDNDPGELGNNSTTQSNVPVQVKDPTGKSTLAGIIAVAAGEGDSLAVKSDGSVWAWGGNEWGELGDGAFVVSSDLPVQVKDSTGKSYLSGVVAVAAGYEHNLALKIDGTVWAWGYNGSGQLGNSSTMETDVPVQVKDPTGTSALTGVIAVSAGTEHSLVVKADGTAWAWGGNDYGLLGNGEKANSTLPVQVENSTGTSILTGVIAVAAGDLHNLALIGNPAPSAALVSSRNPAGVGQPVTFTATISPAAPEAGTPTGTVTFSEGARALGITTLLNGQAAFSTAGLAPGLHVITAIYSGDSNFSSATSGLLDQCVAHTGALCAWGENSDGQLGSGSTIDSSVPVPVSSLAAVAAVAGGQYHSLALRTDGTVWAWGDNDFGELGNGGTANSSVPVQVKDPTGASTLTGIVAISAGMNHSLALKSDGTVWAWGSNTFGQLGTNNIPSYSQASLVGSTLPVQVVDSTGTSTLSGIVAIAAGEYHSLALRSDGTVWAWGSNATGQLGSSNIATGSYYATSFEPVQVQDPTSLTGYLAGVAAVAGGYYHSLALKSDGTVWAWGYNSFGQLGNNSTTDSTVPVPVISLTGVTGVAAGYYHNLALKNDGTAWAWGLNSAGELGNTGTTNSSVPVQVSGLTGATAVAGGADFSLALKGDGTAWTWGDNTNGRLGNNAAISSSVPVQVSGFAGSAGTSSLTRVVGVAAGGGHSLAIANPLPSIVVTTSQNPAAEGLSITFTATVSGAASVPATPTGTVTFLDGTTPLGSVTISNGMAVFPTSTLSSGGHTITASYAGDSTFASASASLTQFIWSAWLPADVSVGADDLSRVLWAHPDGRAVLWSLNRSSGNYTPGPVFGPFDGGAWQATRIACGKDGLSHILWNRADGTLSLWWVNADNTFRSSVFYGPYEGWIATDLSVGSDNLVRILWTNGNDGRVVVWSVDADGNLSNDQNIYGPYPGYTAVAIGCGSDGLTRLLWANPLGIGVVWMMSPDNQQQNVFIFGPYTDWIAADIDVGSDGLARVLWTNNVDERAMVWSVDANGNPSNNENYLGPFTSYTAQRVACGSDGFTRLTWLRGDGVLSFWHMAADNTMLTFNIYGPYF